MYLINNEFLSYFGLFFVLYTVRLGTYIALHSGFFYFVYILALICFDDFIFGLECMKLFLQRCIYSIPLIK
jgi:hypothetical protein